MSKGVHSGTGRSGRVFSFGRKNPVLRSIIGRQGYDEVSWTIKSADEFRTALRDGSVPVFEQITPEELKELTRGGGKED